jgi:hypothetical protein
LVLESNVSPLPPHHAGHILEVTGTAREVLEQDQVFSGCEGDWRAANLEVLGACDLLSLVYGVV